MKTRHCFVSNSSSSSFIVFKHGISEIQKELILNVKDEGFKEDPWYITEDEFCIEGYTSMDNFDMKFYMEKIGIDVEKYVKWGYE
ncbi:MAG: hypothetical protein RBS24_07260 [Bacilli bacterium]|nr:hypothetical protein [Bacilli bacterium]